MFTCRREAKTNKHIYFIMSFWVSVIFFYFFFKFASSVFFSKWNSLCRITHLIRSTNVTSKQTRKRSGKEAWMNREVIEYSVNCNRVKWTCRTRPWPSLLLLRSIWSGNVSNTALACSSRLWYWIWVVTYTGKVHEYFTKPVLVAGNVLLSKGH